MKERTRVVVAMSGGVDSSVAAALLVEAGYEVVGMMLRLWAEGGAENQANRCCTPDQQADARRCAAILGIPFYVIDARAVFRQRIVDSFVEQHSQGQTPNPCLQCNRHIRFGHLLAQARAIGARFLATGHHARVMHTQGHPSRLLRGKDRNKDQSYVLSVLNQEQLQQALFPIGEFSKAEIRQRAETLCLPSASKKDSQDLCFLAGDYRDFLRRERPSLLRKGAIRHQDGQQLGEHQGLANYTIGQRRGLGIGGAAPLYVLALDQENNTLIVGEKAGLARRNFTARDVHWQSGSVPSKPRQLRVQIRYRASSHTAMVEPLMPGRFRLTLDEPLLAITPGQGAVFYDCDDERVLGGGIIEARRAETFTQLGPKNKEPAAKAMAGK